ncbi:hypothetical protein DM02DRAFT_19760 [Periconia macrospinosa]|uniref:Uncharacterized protein n=1 Tax=Periconia macrospinosa TaxID=97972 RepID=A0A2V1DLJ1_9PLEO|nr:hypothetical protein DM02DRAFT_19760 [Periconia macrospinosa]
MYRGPIIITMRFLCFAVRLRSDGLISRSIGLMIPMSREGRRLLCPVSRSIFFSSCFYACVRLLVACHEFLVFLHIVVRLP